MENRSKKVLILSVIMCLLPMVLGIIFYNKLPEQMPIHFTVNDVPDNYAPKNFALFGIPIIMAFVQTICIIFTTKVNELKNSKKPRILKIMEWFIPIITVLLYIIMIEVSLGSTIYVGKSICLILGISFMIIGNYIPKMSYDVGKGIFHPSPKSEKSFRKMSKVMGYLFVIMGIILLIMIIWI
ncbi:MAG: DUF1648 domain-containing protein [Clostridia bacterium]|nr:DUF1648 domain-containing protein [Clostridia bacterium]